MKLRTILAAIAILAVTISAVGVYQHGTHSQRTPPNG